jgi:hypothetical protein
MNDLLRFTFPAALLLFVIPAHAQSLSADDFLPPVQAAAPEQQQALTQVKGTVEEIKDPATGDTAVQATTAQDAINFIVNQHSPGAEMMRVGSGIGWVATGMGSYEVMENPTATRIAKRNAYVRAFLEAKRHLAEALNGLSSEGKTQVLEQMETVSDAQSDLTNFAATQDEKLEQSVQMLLRGFVVYAVEDNTAKKTVSVSIVTTPKTRGQFNRPSPNGLEADSIRDGLNQVIVEIQKGLVPPVGGKIIQVPATGEIAFVGFGSDIVRTSDNATLQSKQQLNAAKIAQMRASDALVGLLIGDDSRWKSKLDESTQQTIAEFEDSDTGEDASRQRFEQTRQSFQNTQRSSEEFQSLRKGVLPPGVTRKNFSSPDNAEMFSIAVYLPSLSRAATQAAKEMSEARLIDSPNGAAGGATTGTLAPPKDVIPRPSREIAPGPTGQISNDQDL